MFNIKTITAIAMTALLITACEKDDQSDQLNISEREVKERNINEEVLIFNSNLLSEINNNPDLQFSHKKKSDKSGGDLINDVNLFFDYIGEYQILENGIVITLEDYLMLHNVSQLQFHNLFLERFNYLQTVQFDKISPYAIRNAMLEECENGYCCGLDDVCSVAVKIAFWLR